MDSREANLPPDHNLYPSFNAATSSSSSSFNSSPPDFLRNVQAAFKRHRMMPELNNHQPRRLVAPIRETSKSSAPVIDSKAVESHDVLVKQRVQDSGTLKSTLTTVNYESATSIIPPSISDTPAEAGKFISIDDQRGLPSCSCDCRVNNMVDLPCKKCTDNKLVDGPEKVQFALRNSTRSHGSLDHMDKGELLGVGGYNMDIQSQPPITHDQVSIVTSVSLKPEKSEKPASKKDASAPRKRNYDPDLFFKVNGKLYQRLGKIGSGGSSEVHKVISQDCTIYALKKIKLKGRDYGTAFGFCQEIEYLHKLRGKDNIIQLIDYEVTDKALLKEVMSGSMSNKDGRVTEDGCIYMVLEYGEIDLAHMLSQKWRELDDSKSTIDENWLRFYWQQILLAVKTIHEERIVHSDLKPANFLLVRGSLKLIDFGIAKAIMSDTTNIQRDSQMGTLSYMSPEAFLCNETDADGNIIKCGRPSDIWSLGCILYQMVYGRTPFADYATFWAKFKVITNPNHEIHYESVPNIWLVDLMKKCLAWDRKERWTIPQLLQHPFLVPKIPLQSPNLVADSCSEDSEIMFFSRLQQLLNDPIPDIKSGSSGPGSISLDKKCSLIDEMLKLCFQLKGQLM